MFIVTALAATGCSPTDVAADGLVGRLRVRVPGARLYLEIHGRRPRGQALLWLHGGPGGCERPLFRLYNRTLEDQFVVGYLDQRGAGKSYDPEADPSHLTIGRHLDDLDVVVDVLRESLEQDRVVLMGHSWGAALGMLYLQRRPEKVAGVVGVAPLVAELDRQRAQFSFVSGEALRRRDRKALAQLRRIGTPPYSVERERAMQGLVDRFGGFWRHAPNPLTLVARGVGEGLLSPWELKSMIAANTASLRAMNDELLRLDLRRSVQSVERPVVFMLGRHDRHVEAALAAAYLERLEAPAKRLAWFDAAHNLPFEAARAFNAAAPRLLAEVGIGQDLSRP